MGFTMNVVILQGQERFLWNIGGQVTCFLRKSTVYSIFVAVYDFLCYTKNCA